MTNPFENPNGSYFVLVNEEGQYSLWPSFLDVPDGWKIDFGEASKEKCSEYINMHWKDILSDSRRLVESLETR